MVLTSSIREVQPSGQRDLPIALDKRANRRSGHRNELSREFYSFNHQFSSWRYSGSTQITSSEVSLPRMWPTYSLSSRYGRPSTVYISATTNDCPKHFSKSVRVSMSSSSRKLGGTPISFTLSLAFMQVIYSSQTVKRWGAEKDRMAHRAESVTLRGVGTM